MKKKDYVNKAVKSILNRVRFHAPIVYDAKIDEKILSAYGVDANKPLFKFDKPLNKELFKAFELASKEEEFNLVISSLSLGKFKERAKKLKNIFVYNNTESVKFLEMLNKLNINYCASSNYNLVYNSQFFKVNSQILNPHFEDFSLKQVLLVDNVFVEYNEFLLNGSNYFVKLQNKNDIARKIELELNIPLNKGYYYFKRMNNCILVENLLTKQKLCFNFLCKNAKFSFSEVDGLENSVYCCLNVKVSLTLQVNEEGFMFFNLGENKFILKSLEEINKFHALARIKACEVFNVQIKSKEAKFDYYFNKKLPQKIWLNWLNGDENLDLEEKYVSLKRLFVKGDNEISFVNFKEIGLKELGIFNGEYYKKILIIKGSERFLRVGRTFFYNINGITNHSLSSKEPISVCFGD